MKKIVLITMLVGTSFGATAAPYAGLEYGFGMTDHDGQSQFKKTSSIKLDPSNSDGLFTGFIGYTVNPQWAIELNYSQFDLEDDHSRFIKYNSATQVKTEEEWDAHVKAKQFTLAPVYTHAITDKWVTKFKAGISYTQYDIDGAHYLENENQISDMEITKPKENYSSSSNKLGGMLSVGTEYEIYPQLALSINAKYQFDSFASTASLNIGSAYYF
ncbi:AcfA family outer membrane beta-barrel protein [Photobacterium damselae]|uniref:AcfA family outer membrane beta-barrel protein n=1 Tax=Photobacterium damselae TaxID=38293 RepID=UPI001F31BA60|nr:AcfA family outer membrane beta-barrel protein [Photobacterium damselae]UKA03980.1 AcfA family outer membrane beta-barrel protein [Photobacterium damselae subsp. damselae]